MSRLHKKKIRSAFHSVEKIPTLRHMLFAITAAYAHAIDNVSLFCFIAKPPSLVRARRTRSPVDDIQLAVLPTAVPHPRSGNVQK